MTKATWPTEPKVLSTYSFTGNVCSPLIQVIMVWLKDMVTSLKSISKSGNCGLLNRFLQTGRQLRKRCTFDIFSLTNILVKSIIMWSTHSNNLTRVFLPGLLILLFEQENRLLLSTYPQRGYTWKDEEEQYNHLSSAGACNKMEAAVFQMLPFQLLKTCCPHVRQAGNNGTQIFLLDAMVFSFQGSVVTCFFFISEKS